MTPGSRRCYHESLHHIKFLMEWYIDLCFSGNIICQQKRAIYQLPVISSAVEPQKMFAVTLPVVIYVSSLFNPTDFSYVRKL